MHDRSLFLDVVDHRFGTRSGQTKDYQSELCWAHLIKE